MTNEQLLLEGVNGLYELLDYYLVVSFYRNNILNNITITFRETDFYHILGLQYLSDVDDLKRNKVLVVRKIKTSMSFREKTCNSAHFQNEIPDRLYAIIDLLENFECGKNLFYFFDKKHISFPTKINADYFIKSDFTEDDSLYRYFYFIIKRKENDNYVFDSMFLMGTKDYSSKAIGHNMISFTAHKISTNTDIVLSTTYF